MNEQSQSVARSTAWVLAGRYVERGLGIVSIAILARALTPAAFGIVGIASSLVGIVTVFSNFGFDWALVRMKSPTRDHYDTAWTLRIMLGLATAAILLLSAFPAATFFRQAAVAPILAVMALNALIQSFENIGVVDFRRDMRFDKEFRIRLSGRLAGFVASIAIALLTGSYWALVLGMTASRVGTVIASYWNHPYRPRWCVRMRHELVAFSGWLLVGNVAEALRGRFAEAWIGQSLGPKSVGLYSMASELSELATTEFAAPLNRVMYTRYSSLSGEIKSLRDAFLQASGVILVIGIPAAAGLAICARPIVRVLLGTQWGDSAILLQLLALAGAASILAASTQYVYWALGRSRFVSSLNVLGAATFVLLVLTLGNRFGLRGIAASQVASSCLVVTLNFIALVPTLELRFSDLGPRCLRVLAATGAMLAAVHAVSDFDLVQHAAALVQLAVMVATGVVAYSAVLGGLWFAVGRPTGGEEQVAGLARKLIRTLRGPTPH